MKNICSGELAMLIAGPVVYGERAGAHAKSNMFLFGSTMSCFQGENGGGGGGGASPATECIKVLYFSFRSRPVKQCAQRIIEEA